MFQNNLPQQISIQASKQANKLNKACPLQLWSGPEGSRKLRFQDFMTMAQEGGKVVSLRTGCLYFSFGATAPPLLPPSGPGPSHARVL